jgi:uncharacterized membrane protein
MPAAGQDAERRGDSMKSGKLEARTIALVAVMAAVTCVFTLIRFPIMGGRGYVHLGDMAANFAAVAFGPWFGMAIAGGGMALADILSGYAFFAPATLIIHGLQGFVVGYIAFLSRRNQVAMLVGAILGEVIMVVGYFIAELTFYRYGLPLALAEVPWNLAQGLFGLLGVYLFLMVARAYPPLLMRGGDRGGSDTGR